MVKRNLFFNILLSVSGLIFPLITFPYASRILGPQGVGSVNFIDSFTQYFMLFAALGVPYYGIREISKLEKGTEIFDKTFSEIFLIHLTSTALFSIIYLIIALSVKNIKVHLDLALVGIASMYFNVFAVEWFYQGIEQFEYITKRTLIIRSLTIILLFLFFKPGSKPVIYVVIFTTVIFLNGLMNALLLKKHVKIRLSNLQLKKHVKPLFIIFSSAIAVSVYTLLDNMLLGFIKGETAVGIYSTALKIVRIPFALIIAISSVIVPQVSRACSEARMDDVNSLINKSFAFICIIGLPIVFGLFVSSSFLIKCFAGVTFSAASGVIQLLSPVIMLIGINSLFGAQLLTPMGKEKILLKLALICMFFSLVCNVVLIPAFSYIGAGITNILTEALLAGMLFYVVYNEKAVSIKPAIFFQCLCGALLFIPIAYTIRFMTITYLLKEVLIILTCIAVYGLYLWFLVKNIYIENLKELVANKLRVFKIAI